MSFESLHVEKNLLGKSASEIANEYKQYQEEIIGIKKKITKAEKEVKKSSNFAKNLSNIFIIFNLKKKDEILSSFFRI